MSWWDAMDQDYSGIRYCQDCGEKQFLQNVYSAVCRQCGKRDKFADRPRPHVGVIAGFWLTDSDKVFLKVNRIAYSEKESLS